MCFNKDNNNTNFLIINIGNFLLFFQSQKIMKMEGDQ